MSPFKKKVIEVVQSIPYGKVVSYGQIALYVGVPRAARQVGGALKELEESVPWWRVVNNSGIISIDGNLQADRDLQKKLLRTEGIEVADYKINIKKYRFIADEKVLQRFSLENRYIKEVLRRFSL